MARAAPVSADWLPSYAWWPPPGDYGVTVFLSPYSLAVEPEAEFAFELRGYAGSDAPLWEHDAGVVSFGEQRVLDLDDLVLPAPPDAHGGILEVHAVRHDRPPKQGTGVNTVLLDVRGRSGGGYLIPTVPIRGAAKSLVRDDVQVVPGVMADRETDTELLILNPIGQQTEVRFTLSSLDGLTAESRTVTVGPWAAWQGTLKDLVRQATRLLAPGGGIGSLAMTSTHRMLPFFALRRRGHPVVAFDHAAPIFAPVTVKRRLTPETA